MSVHVVTMAARAGRLSLRLDPAHHFLALGSGVVDVGAEYALDIDRAVLADQELGGRVDLVQPLPQRLDRLRLGDIGLGQHDAIRHRRLLERFLLAVELIEAVHGIHCGDDRAEPVVVAQRDVVHQSREDRRRVGKPGGLDDHAAIGRHDATRALVVDLHDRLLEVVPDGAAEAAAREQDRALVHGLHQLVVDADFAELVNEHRRIAKRGVLQEAVEQGRLAAA